MPAGINKNPVQFETGKNPEQSESGNTQIPAHNTATQTNTPEQFESGAANTSTKDDIPVQIESGDCIPERTPHTATNNNSQGPIPITQEEDWTCKGAIPGDGLRRSKRVKQ